MVSATSDEPAGAQLVKMLIIGEPGSGVTSFIGAVSDHPPVSSPHHPGLDGDTAAEPGMVPVDFGSCLLNPDGLQLGLFGAHTRRLWPDLARDAVAAVALAHSSRISDACTTVAAVEQAEVQIPFVVAVNVAGDDAPTAAGVRTVLDLPHRVPVVLCDSRHRTSVTNVLADATRQALVCTPVASVGRS